MFEARKAAVEDEMKQLEKTLDMLKFKCWYYVQAIKDGSEDATTPHASLFFFTTTLTAPSRQSGFSHTGSARPAA